MRARARGQIGWRGQEQTVMLERLPNSSLMLCSLEHLSEKPRLYACIGGGSMSLCQLTLPTAKAGGFLLRRPLLRLPED